MKVGIARGTKRTRSRTEPRPRENKQLSLPETAREVRLAERPSGWPTDKTFETATVPVSEPAAGQLLVRNLVMSVDPAMRGQMDDRPSYVAPFQVGEPLTGAAVGEVVASEAEGFQPGDLVMHVLGWREYAVLDAGAARRLDPELADPNAFLGVLGAPGLTAYTGLFEITGLRETDVVFISGAAGAVGSIAGQLAKLHGARRVIGSAGSDEKVRHLTEDLGFDAAFNYKRGPVHQQLVEAAPDGIDVYFDNVGGDHLEAAIHTMNDFGRIAMCGAISQYNEVDAQPGPRGMFQMVSKRLTARGFIVIDHFDKYPEFMTEVGGWLRQGRIRYEETVLHGLDRAPEAFLGMMRGENTGKMLVDLR
ncbi:NADP-dependent oxidoreductase [Actinopolyspora alba]|uniref:NADP-dependent oxidoreductase n=1 Tax=Actinopolyspora alba TaxID=673379 RepID=UPI001587D110|nr:NADP-dependent oxidoreductase [Actinopolyspora alba]